MGAAAHLGTVAEWPKSSDQAGDLACADVERGDDARAPRVQRLHAGSETA
jgi:hypothetical protein